MSSFKKARNEAKKKPEAQKYAEALQRRLEAINKSIAEKRGSYQIWKC